MIVSLPKSHKGNDDCQFARVILGGLMIVSLSKSYEED